MILSEGKNRFLNNKFSYWEWSAPILQTHDELIAKFKELKLEGRKIKNIRCIGMAYNWRDDVIADYVDTELDAMKPEEKRNLPNPEAFLPEGVYFFRCIEIDEPLLIEFEDGDVLAIDFSEGSSVRIDMNTLPADITFGINSPTIHANKLFGDAIGKEIVAIDISTSTVRPEFTGSFGLSLDEQAAYITGFAIRYRTKDAYYKHNSLVFESFIDYGVVELKNQDNEIMKIHAPEVKEVVKDFIGDEILK